MMKIVEIAILILLLVLPSISHAADIYKWVDKNGTAHFTDDISKVPPEYRDQVKTEAVSEGTPITQESKLFKQEELDQMLAPKIRVRSFILIFPYFCARVSVIPK